MLNLFHLIWYMMKMVLVLRFLQKLLHLILWTHFGLKQRQLLNHRHLPVVLQSPCRGLYYCFRYMPFIFSFYFYTSSSTLITASHAAEVFVSTLKTSPAEPLFCNTTLLPDSISSDEPAGIGAS